MFWTFSKNMAVPCPPPPLPASASAEEKRAYLADLQRQADEPIILMQIALAVALVTVLICTASILLT